MARKKSIEELKKAGTYRKSRHSIQGTAGNLLTELPPPPFDLIKEANQVYQEEGQRLIEMQMLKLSDLRTLAMYANEYATYITETAAAQKEGVVVVLSNGVTSVSHHRRAAESALKLARDLGDKLGLNPNARHRLKGVAAFRNSEPEKASSILNLITGGNKTATN